MLKNNGAILGRLYLEISKRHYINCCTLDPPTQTVPRVAARVSTLRIQIRKIAIYKYESHTGWIIFLFQKSERQQREGVVHATLLY